MNTENALRLVRWRSACRLGILSSVIFTVDAMLVALVHDSAQAVAALAAAAAVALLGLTLFGIKFAYCLRKCSPPTPAQEAVLKDVARTLGIPYPKLYVQANHYVSNGHAFKLPCFSAVVFINTAASGLESAKLRGLLAHELGHVVLRHALGTLVVGFGLALLQCLIVLLTLSSGIPFALELSFLLGVVGAFITLAALAALEVRPTEFEADAIATIVSGKEEQILWLLNKLLEYFCHVATSELGLSRSECLKWFTEDLDRAIAFAKPYDPERFPKATLARVRWLVGRLFSSHPPTFKRIENIQHIASLVASQSTSRGDGSGMPSVL